MKNLTKAQLEAARKTLLKLAREATPEKIEKLSRAGFQSNSLPALGKFGKVIWDDTNSDPTFHHFRLTVQNSDLTCSVNCLRALITPTPEEFKVTPKGFIVQSGLKAVNPSLSALSILDTCAFLEGEDFKAEEIVYKSVKFKDGGWMEADGYPDPEKDLEVKTTFRLS